jgi:hypothetical protein
MYSGALNKSSSGRGFAKGHVVDDDRFTDDGAATEANELSAILFDVWCLAAGTLSGSATGNGLLR